MMRDIVIIAKYSFMIHILMKMNGGTRLFHALRERNGLFIVCSGFLSNVRRELQSSSGFTLVSSLHAGRRIQRKVR